LLGVGRVIGCAVQADAGRQLAQHGGLADAAAFDVMGFLLGSQHLQALAGQRFGRQQGRGRGLGVQRRANVIEQAVEIGIAKGWPVISAMRWSLGMTLSRQSAVMVRVWAPVSMPPACH
jgi:hypothetical protein